MKIEKYEKKVEGVYTEKTIDRYVRYLKQYSAEKKSITPKKIIEFLDTIESVSHKRNVFYALKSYCDAYSYSIDFDKIRRFLPPLIYQEREILELGEIKELVSIAKEPYSTIFKILYVYARRPSEVLENMKVKKNTVEFTILKKRISTVKTYPRNIHINFNKFKRVDISTIDKKFKKYLRLTENKKNATPHTLRHSRFSHLCLTFSPLLLSKELLLHSPTSLSRVGGIPVSSAFYFRAMEREKSKLFENIRNIKI